ncbi:MAG: DUF6133 family protein [Christensenella sp.]
MKNFIKKLSGLYLCAKSKLMEEKGSFFTENALVIVITVAIAGIVLLLMVTLFKTTIFPQLTAKISEFFAFT